MGSQTGYQEPWESPNPQKLKGREFWARDIANVSMSQLNGAIKLYGHDGKALAQFNNSMNNAPLMMQWLKEHNIPLRG